MQIVLIVFGIIFFTTGLAAVGRSAWRHVRCVSSQNWNCVSGQITHSKDESRIDRDSCPLVSYEYSVNGSDYIGSRIKFDHSDYSYQSTKAKLKAYPAGRKVDVFFDPNAPQNSVLEPGVESLRILIYNHIFAAGILVLGTVILVLGSTL